LALKKTLGGTMGKADAFPEGTVAVVSMRKFITFI
jgi:hypothetical protein